MPNLTFDGVRYVALDEATAISCVVYGLPHRYGKLMYYQVRVISCDAVPLAPSRET